MDFQLEMNVYDYKNELHEIYGSFKKLQEDQLCFIQDMGIATLHDVDSNKEGEEFLYWYDTTESVSHYIELKESTEKDIEEHIKWCFDNYGIKYDYVKVKFYK